MRNIKNISLTRNQWKIIANQIAIAKSSSKQSRVASTIGKVVKIKLAKSDLDKLEKQAMIALNHPLMTTRLNKRAAYNGSGFYNFYSAVGAAEEETDDDNNPIMNEEEKEAGDELLQAVKDGDVQKFDELFGIYNFGSPPLDVYAFASLVDASAIGNVEMVKFLIEFLEKSRNKFYKQEVFASSMRKAIENQHIEIIKMLFPFCNLNLMGAFAIAAGTGNMDIIKLLLPMSKPDDNKNAAILSATRGGHVEVVKMLLPLIKSAYGLGSSLDAASRKGNLEIVKLLLPFAKRYEAGSALYWAAKSNHIEVVKLLLPFTSREERVEALKSAAVETIGNKHTEIINLLLPYSDEKERAKILQYVGYYRNTPIETADEHRKLLQEYKGHSANEEELLPSDPNGSRILDL